MNEKEIEEQTEKVKGSQLKVWMGKLAQEILITKIQAEEMGGTKGEDWKQGGCNKESIMVEESMQIAKEFVRKFDSVDYKELISE